MSLESGAVGAIIAKFGAAKALTLGAALIGAAVMAVFRPPKSRKEMFYQGAVALGSSMLFGGFGVALVDSWLHLGADTLIVPIHGLIGAMSWGLFGGLAHLRDKAATDPIGTAKEIKDVVSK
jgi:hypothetical protein